MLRLMNYVLLVSLVPHFSALQRDGTLHPGQTPPFPRAGGPSHSSVQRQSFLTIRFGFASVRFFSVFLPLTESSDFPRVRESTSGSEKYSRVLY